MKILVFLALANFCVGCELLDNDEHKSFWPPCPIEVVCYVLIFVICNLANATGIGGGGMLVPLLILLMQFKPREAIPLSKSIILGGAIVSVIMSMCGKNKMLIDYRIVSLLQPMILLGTAVGVTLNQVFPEILILLMLILTLCYVIYKTTTKAVNLFKKESENFELEAKRNKEEELQAGELELVSKGTTTEVSYTFEAVPFIQKLPKKSICLIMMNYFSVLLFALMKGGGGGTYQSQSIIGLAACSTGYWFLVGFYIIFCILSTLQAYKYSKPEIKWSLSNLLCYSSVAFLGGIGSGMLGLGGGVIISPLMLDIGVSPQSTAASSSLMVLFTSSSTTLQFFLGNMLDIQYASIMFVISMLSSMTGIKIVGKMIEKYKRPSIIVFLLAGITGFSAILLPLYAFSMKKSTSAHGIC